MKTLAKDGKIARIADPISIFNYFDKETKLSTLQVINGGKDGGSKDWLSPLPVNTIFIIEDIANPNNFMMLRLRIGYKYDKAILLYENMSEKPLGIVNPVRFCNQYRLVQIVERPEEEQEVSDG